MNDSSDDEFVSKDFESSESASDEEADEANVGDADEMKKLEDDGNSSNDDEFESFVPPQLDAVPPTSEKHFCPRCNGCMYGIDAESLINTHAEHCDGGRDYMRRVVELLLYSQDDEAADELIADENGVIPDASNYLGRERFLMNIESEILESDLRKYCDLALHPINLAFVGGHQNAFLRHGEFYRRVGIKFEHLLELLKTNPYVLHLVRLLKLETIKPSNLLVFSLSYNCSSKKS